MSNSARSLEQSYELLAGEQVSVVDLFERTLARRGYTADASQLAAVKRLQQLQDEWGKYKHKRRTMLHRSEEHTSELQSH